MLESDFYVHQKVVFFSSRLSLPLDYFSAFDLWSSRSSPFVLMSPRISYSDYPVYIHAPSLLLVNIFISEVAGSYIKYVVRKIVMKMIGLA